MSFFNRDYRGYIMNQNFYQVGGTLPIHAPSYINREADKELYLALKEGKYCYVLNARQVGKSSLLVHTSQRLQQEEYICINIDLTSIGSEDITAEDWYFSFLYKIIEKLYIEEDEVIEWWDNNDKLTIVNRFYQIFDKFILEKTQQNIIIFIDEVDSLLGIKQGFSTNDFFAVIRTFYNQRSEDKRYNRLSFALFGVAMPDDLMEDSTRTPFNIAHSITIKQLKLEKAMPLLDGLTNPVIGEKAILKKIFEWTEGTPYLTQKILDYIAYKPIEKLEDIDKIVDKLFIEKNFKEINIGYIQKMILGNEEYSIRMLYLIYDIITDNPINEGKKLEQIYLKLSGLIKEENGLLQYSNKIYKKVFNKAWVEESINKIDRPFSKDLQRWVELNRPLSALLKGEVLEKANLWALKREDLTIEEHRYLRLSILNNQEEVLAQEKKRSELKKIQYLSTLFILLLLFTVGLWYEYQELEDTKKALTLQDNNNRKQKELLQENIALIKNQNQEFAKMELKFQKQEELLASTLFSDSLKDSEKTYLIILKRYQKLAKENPQNYKLKLAKTFKSLAVIYNLKNDFNKTINNYKEALNIYRGLDDNISVYEKAKIYNRLADIYIETKALDKAQEHYIQAMSIYKALNKDASEAKILNALGLLNITEKRDLKAKEYLKSSLNIYEKLSKKGQKKYLSSIAYLSQDLADIYRKEKRIKEAKRYYKKALDIFNSNKKEYKDEISKLTLQIELNKLEKKRKKLVKIKKNKGWVYLGEYNDQEWIKQHFKFEKYTSPKILINTYQISTSTLNIRKKAFWGDVIGVLHEREKVKIIKLKDIGIYKWGYVEY